MKTHNILSKTFILLAIAGSSLFSKGVGAQNLIVNPGFQDGTSGWGTDCSIEINPETVYGGTNAANKVTEIDIERCFKQQVAVSAGATYDFSFKASRRQGGTPATVGVTVTITGVESGTQYLNISHTYTNTTWAYTTENFSVSIPVGTTDTRVVIRFSNYMTTGTYGTLIDDINFSVNPLSATLPVRLTAFTGNMKGGNALLSWTASNDDRDGLYFIVERAAAGGGFDSIGLVTVSGTAYAFADTKMLSGINNYRLKVVSLGGSTYSKVISLNNAGAAQIRIYPNPATSAIGFRLNSAAKNTVNIQVYSLGGSMVAMKQMTMNAGMNTGTVDITSLRPGSFFLKISDDQGMNYVQEFCKR